MITIFEILALVVNCDRIVDAMNSSVRKQAIMNRRSGLNGYVVGARQTVREMTKAARRHITPLGMTHQTAFENGCQYIVGKPGRLHRR